jgi:tape measure domain-containing protein
MAETNEFYIKIGADVDDAMNKLNRLSNQLSQLASSTQRSSSSISSSMNNASSSISSAFSAIGINLTQVGIAAAIIGVGKAALTTAAELEQISISFKVFTGNVEVADKMLAQLKEQALNSPMQFQDIAKGAQTLLGYGLTAQQVIPITKMLGDISGGNADRFSRLSLAFGQVTASGRLMGQEARQMINAGFNPLQAISEKTGESMASLTQRMHDGQISVREVAQAFVYATSEGGRFFGNAEQQAKSLGGIFNRLSESVTFALADIGESMKNTFDISGVVLILTNSISILKDSFKAFNTEGASSTVWATMLKGAVIGLTIALDILIKTFKLLKLGAEEIIGTIGKRLGQAISVTSEYIFDALKRSPGIGGLTVTVNDYFKNIVNKATSTNSNVKKSKSELEKLRDEYEKILKTFSGEPSKKPTKKKATEKVETIIGTDFQTKDEGSKIKRLIELNKDAALKIKDIWLTGTDEKLAKLKTAYELEIQDYVKYQLDYSNITKKYEAERDKIIDEANKKRESDKIKSFAEEIAGIKSVYPKISADFAKDMLDDDILNKMRDYGQAFYSSSKDLAVNIASGFAEIATSALFSGSSVGDAFKSLGGLILDSLGDYLIKIGTAAIAAGVVGTVLKTFFTGGAATVPELGIAGGMAAVAVGTAMKALSGKVSASMDKNKMNNASSTSGTSASTRVSGASYQYGGSSYSTQSVKLSIDLTGAITATQTGYQINKSLETTLRVTGR